MSFSQPSIKPDMLANENLRRATPNHGFESGPYLQQPTHHGGWAAHWLIDDEGYFCHILA